jgi:hypothetical protein
VLHPPSNFIPNLLPFHWNDFKVSLLAGWPRLRLRVKASL